MKINKIFREQTEPIINYRQRVKNRFKQQITDITTKYSLSQLVIVLDNTSAFLLSNIFTITQLVAMKIIYIQKLQVKRKKLDKHAVYFVSPTKNNIQLIINDFPTPYEQIYNQNSKTNLLQKQRSKQKQKNKSKDKNKYAQQTPQYRRIHILFTTFIDKNLLKMLAINKGVLKRIARNSLKQFYFSARILAPNLIDMSIPYLSLAFSKQSQQQVYKRQLICKKIIQFIANYQQINTIRIFYKKSPNKICENISKSLQNTIKQYLGILLNNRSPNLKKQAQDLTILILDRSIDTVTPFIHYLTYQSLLFDFFKINMVTKNNLQDKSSYSYQQIQNSIYDQFRYRHISQALSRLPQLLQDQKGKLQNLKSSNSIQSKTINIKQLTQRVAQIKSNIDKLQSIWNQFKNRKIQDIADLQQSLATGITANNQNTSSIKLIQQVCKLIKDVNIDRQQRLRLGILCLTCIKLSKQDYQNLLSLFNNQDKKILKNLIALGISYDGNVSKSTKTITKDQQKIAQKRKQTTGMYLNRYTSIVQLIVPLFCKILQDPLKSQSIDKQVFGEYICSIFNKDGNQDRKFKSTRFAMCMIGGLSWSEVSAIRNADGLQNIVLMADAMMTVKDFLDQISKINIFN